MWDLDLISSVIGKFKTNIVVGKELKIYRLLD